jgi:hypothetical protein
MTAKLTPLVAPLLADFLVSIDRLAGRAEVEHTITHWTDRHATLLGHTARMDGQVVFDAVNSALVQIGCCTEDAVQRADEARYWQAKHLSLVATDMLHRAAYIAAEELVGVVRHRWMDLDPVLDLIAANLSAATTLTTEGSST